MSMLTGIIESSGQARNIRCPIGRFKQENPELAAELDEALEATNPDGGFVVSGVAIARYLNQTYGLSVRDAAVRGHRREDCACPQ